MLRIAHKVGNDLADSAADFSCRRHLYTVSSGRRALVEARHQCCSLICDLRRFFIATCSTSVNLDGTLGTAPDPLCWSAAGRVKVRRIPSVVPSVVRDSAGVPGSSSLWSDRWVS